MKEDPNAGEARLKCGTLHRFPVLIAAFTLASILASAQGSPAGQPEAGFSPFATRLKARVIDYQVKLTWKDSPDLKGIYVVYRSSEEITSQTFARALPSGQSGCRGRVLYRHTAGPEGRGSMPSLIQDTGGDALLLFCPLPKQNQRGGAGLTAAPEKQLAAQISGIKAAVRSGETGLTSPSPPPARRVTSFFSGVPRRFRPRGPAQATSDHASSTRAQPELLSCRSPGRGLLVCCAGCRHVQDRESTILVSGVTQPQSP